MKRPLHKAFQYFVILFTQSFFLFSASLFAQTNNVHVWTFTTGKTFPGNYVTSNDKIVVINSSGTNYSLYLAYLTDDDQMYALTNRLAVETNDFFKKGWVEFTEQKIDDFPEQVDNKAGWMDCSFIGFDINLDDTAQVAGADFILNMDVEDQDSNFYHHVHILKNLPDGTANPVATQAQQLKRGDKIRIIGVVMDAGTDSSSLTVQQIEKFPADSNQ